MKKYLLLLCCIWSSAQAQPTRITAYSKYIFDYMNGSGIIPLDSNHYSYSNHRPGWKNYSDESILCDKNEVFDWKPAPANNWGRKRNILKKYDSNNNTLQYMILSWNTTTSAFDSSSDHIYTYTGNDTSTITMYGFTGGTRSLERRHTRNYASGKVISKIDELWNAATMSYDPYSHSYQIYDGTGKLVVDSGEYYDNVNMVWKPSRTVYTYSGNNLINQTFQYFASGTWKTSQTLIWAYDASNRIILHEKQSEISGTWATDEKHTYSYNASGYLLTDNIFILYTGTTPTFAGSDNYVYNGSKLSLVWGTNDVGDSTSKQVYTYDTYGNLSQYELYEKSVSSWAVTDLRRYYYEPVFAAGIRTEQPATDLQVFPIPAAHMLNIHLSFNTPQAFTASIYDMQGRVVKTWKEDATAEYNESINVDGLAQGSYILSLQGKEQVSKTFIVK